MSQLWLPRSVQETLNHKKSDNIPKLGEGMGAWAGRDNQFFTLPGGGVIQFDLSRLNLADFRQMRDHYQINASLSVLQFMMHQIDWKIKCTDPKIATFLEENIGDMWTRLIRGISQAYWSGYSPMSLQFENDLPDGKVRLTQVKDLVPEESRVNWKKIDGYKPPGANLAPRHNVYDGIKQFGAVYPIPAPNTLWYPLLMENGDYYGKKLLRPAFSSWFFSILLHLFSNRYFERFGEPVPVGRADYEDEVTMDGKTFSGKQAMETILTQLRNRSVVVLPSTRTEIGNSGRSEYDYDIEYLESQMRGADFERYMSRLDEEMSLGLFTPLLLLRSGDTGSYNLGVAHMQMYMYMLNALAGDFKQYIDNYLVKTLKEVNFPNAKATRAEFVFQPMGKQNVETMRAVVTSLMASGGAKPDFDQLSDIIGLKIEEQEVLTAPVAKPGDSTPPPAGGSDPTKRNDIRVRTRPKSSGPKTAGQPRATGKAINARIKSQVDKAYREGSFGAGFTPSIGYRRRFEEALIAEGADVDTAFSLTDSMYSRIDAWLEDVIAAGINGFATPEDFMEVFEAMMDIEIDSLVS